jgi:hypothetical protein
MCSMSSDPQWDEQTNCTAVAADAVLTVRTCGTGPLYGPRVARVLSAVGENPQATTLEPAANPNRDPSQV